VQNQQYLFYKLLSNNTSTSSMPKIKGLVFDLDGTLTVPVLDFKLMRERTGIIKGDMLDEIEKMPLGSKERQRCEQVIHDMERTSLIINKLLLII